MLAKSIVEPSGNSSMISRARVRARAHGAVSVAPRSDGSELVFLGLDEVSVDRLFAQCLARFEPMQTVHKDKAIAIAPN